MAGNRKKPISSGQFVLTEDMPFSFQEAYKAVRTRLMFSLPGEHCKKIIVTSAQQHEGKSYTAINLSIAMAAMEKRVLLVDADLRQPTVYRKLHLVEAPGLSNVLSGVNLVADPIRKTPYGIDVLTAGDIPPNPSELLGSMMMEELVRKLENIYDYIFFDVPPLGVVTDATMLAKVASGAVVVVRSGQTNRRELDDVVEGLKLVNIKMLGFILVGTKKEEKKYGSYSKRG